MYPSIIYQELVGTVDLREHLSMQTTPSRPMMGGTTVGEIEGVAL